MDGQQGTPAQAARPAPRAQARRGTLSRRSRRRQLHGPPSPADVSPLALAELRRAEGGFFRIIVRDNGKGMPHKDIPRMLAVVLSGTNYGVKQVGPAGAYSGRLFRLA